MEAGGKIMRKDEKRIRKQVNGRKRDRKEESE